tara:strand:- start:72 stop:569 length:498 start_codon:yes stop_codon:yes gene_type:complete
MDDINKTEKQENKLIDIHKLNNMRDYRFKKRIEVYDTFLKRCLQKIQQITRDRSYCNYKVPLFSLGLPLFNRNKCVYYLYHKLKHLGFEVSCYPDLTLYISWGHIPSYIKEPELKKTQEIEEQTNPMREKVKKYRDIQDANNMIQNNFIYNMKDYNSNIKHIFKK